MKCVWFLKYGFTFLMAFLGWASFGDFSAQAQTGTLRTQVLDPSGATVATATVLVTSPTGTMSAATMNKDGVYEVKGLAAGKYTVQVTAKGFALFELKDVDILAGQVKKLDISLQIEVQQEQVTIQGQAETVNVNPTSNVSALVIKGKDLDALADDPDQLASDLEALAGPAAGPNGGQIYIDGFTGGQLPPKSSIREIRVNQNPFSAQYDHLGYGRIEIFTKPGTDKLHGQVNVNFNQSALNSRNPFITVQPSYHSERYGGNLGGALSKKASFFVSAERRNIADNAIISAYVLDSNFNPAPFSQALPNPRTRTAVSPRIDYQLSSTNTLTVRYMYEHEGETNNGVGLFSLPSQGFDVQNTEHTIQVSDTQTLGEKTVNELRFRYQRERTDEVAQNFEPTIRVLSAFTGGGSSVGTALYHENHYELQDYAAIAAGKHFLKFGGRLRVMSELNRANSNFNGTFTFGSLDRYAVTQRGLQQGWTPEQIRAAGGGADQFFITTGNPRADVNVVDLGVYAEDDWRLRSNMSLSLGLRYETQNEISDHADFAPRMGFAWGLGGKGKTPPKTVLRAGFGFFYERFPQDLILEARRLNGLNQQQYFVTLPDFFPQVPDLATLAASQTLPTVYSIDAHLHAPYMMQAATSIERQLSKTTTASVTYLNTRGVLQLLTRNINAPLPGTYDPLDPTSGLRPYGNVGNIYQFESGGIFRQNQLMTNLTIRGGRRLSLFSNYTLNYANSNTAGASSFPENQYDLRANYGRAAFDIRHRAFFGGTLSLPRAFSINPFVMASSGRPFDITLGRDVNGDSIFNDRPALATDLTRPSVVVTKWGAFDTAPTASQGIIPPNYGTGPGMFIMALRVSKTIGFGKKLEAGAGGVSGGPGGPRGPHGHRGGPGGGLGPQGLTGGGGFGGWDTSVNRRYSLTLSVWAHNVFNFVNLAPPVGSLSSPLFGRSNATAGGPFSTSANRRIDFQVMFNF